MSNIRRGFSLLELSLGLVLVVSVVGTVIVSSRQVMEHARGQRTVADMTAILQACRQYDALNGGWPSALSALHDVLPQALLNNVWGYPFMVASDAQRAWVDTDVPAGAIQAFPGKSRVRLSTGRAHGPAARLVYEKRNIYDP